MKVSLVLSCSLALSSLLASQGTFYVDATATGTANGKSWGNAYTSLTTALSAASAGEIWVARGRYVPIAKNASFALKSKLALYGGFSGSETKREERDPTTNLTILSGDINGDDKNGPGYYRDNATHVVTGTALAISTVLDGFTISGGEATGNDSGAGIDLHDSSLTIINCHITGNRASWGGGISAHGNGWLHLTECALNANYVHLYRGGALSLDTGAKARLVNCEISHNTIRSGATHGNGAGIYAGLGTVLELQGCQMTNNVVNFVFGGSGYAPSGGAITFLGTSLKLDRCRFEANQAPAGGAIYTYGSATIKHCVFANNKAVRAFNIGGWGGAIVNTSRAVSTVDHCVIYGNTASEDGGGIYGNKTITVSNSIIWGNRDSNGQVSESQVKRTKQRFCCIQNYLTARPGEDPIDPQKFPGCTLKDPLFVGAASYDFRLQTKSPCIDTGDPVSPGTGLDLFGNPRKLDGDLSGAWGTDMGVHEYSNIYLDLSVTSSATTHTITMQTSGLTGLSTWIVIGPKGPELAVSPFGTLFVDSARLALVPLGAVPAQLQFSLPSSIIPQGGIQLSAQALGFRGTAGNTSNPLVLNLR